MEWFGQPVDVGQLRIDGVALVVFVALVIRNDVSGHSGEICELFLAEATEGSKFFQSARESVAIA